MKGNFVERPNELMALNEIKWQAPKYLTDEDGMTWSCLPVECEAQMFHSASCRAGCGRPAHWVGVGKPFEDGPKYLLQSQAWCYWHCPRENFTEEELPLIKQADWARKETKAEIADFVRWGGSRSLGDTVNFSDVADDIESFR